LSAYSDAFLIIFYSYTVTYRRDGQNNGNTNKLRNIICVGYIEYIRMDLGEIGWNGVDWIDLAQDRDQWRALVNTVMNLRVP
jgi:hypothetical protein